MQERTTRPDPWPWLGVACAIAFIALGALVILRGGLGFDEPFTAFVQGLPIPSGSWVVITSLGDETPLLPIAVALVIVAALAGRFRLALIVAAVLIAATLFTDLLKDVVTRPRPPGVHLVAADGYSFPSGHALRSAAVYGVVAVVAWRSSLPPAVRVTAVVAGVTLPLLIGLSRIALGVHYPSDVLAGWLAGIAFVALAATLIGTTRATRRDWPRRAAPPRESGP